MHRAHGMTKNKLERWIYLGLGLSLAASAVTTWVMFVKKAKRRVPAVRLPDAPSRDRAEAMSAEAMSAEATEEPSVPTVEQLLADDDAFRAASRDTFDVLEQPALDDSASESIDDDDSLFGDELGRN